MSPFPNAAIRPRTLLEQHAGLMALARALSQQRPKGSRLEEERDVFPPSSVRGELVGALLGLGVLAWGAVLVLGVAIRSPSLRQ